MPQNNKKQYSCSQNSEVYETTYIFTETSRNCIIACTTCLLSIFQNMINKECYTSTELSCPTRVLRNIEVCGCS